MNPPRTILLDAAGTLIEPAEPVASVYARHFVAAGFQVGESTIRKAFGQVFGSLPPPDYANHPDGDLSERAWWRGLVRDTALRCGVSPGEQSFEVLFTGLFNHYAVGRAWRVFPEVTEVLRSLKAAGCRLAIVSNFDRRLHRILDELALASWFSVVITSADASSRKPDSGIFNTALEMLGQAPSEVVHIGDSAAADQVGAENVGIRAFLLDRPRVTLFDALEWIRSGFTRK